MNMYLDEASWRGIGAIICSEDLGEGSVLGNGQGQVGSRDTLQEEAADFSPQCLPRDGLRQEH